MLIENLGVKGFKCFSELRLSLGKLTVLTGFNSAGKSSAIQPLLILAQALRKSGVEQSVSLNGDLLNLGTAGEVLTTGGPEELVFSVGTVAEAAEWKFRPSRTLGGQYLSLSSLSHSGKTSKQYKVVLPARLKKSKLLNKIRDLVFVSPSRLGTPAIYLNPVGEPTKGDVGLMGAAAPWWYVQLADDEVPEERRHPEERSSTLRGQIDAYLGELFPGAKVNCEALPKTGATRVEFKVGTTDWLRPSNVGFGLSFLFPLLVCLLSVPPERLVIIDSPEAHLHPSAQSAMGRLLGRMAAGGVQIIVETHSDHVLSGIRLSVLQRILSPDHVNLHFFGPILPNENNVSSPRLDSTGSIDSWPEGFFDQAQADLARLAGWSD